MIEGTPEHWSWLACPACRGALENKVSSFDCGGCGESFPIRNGVPVFVNMESMTRPGRDPRGLAKRALRKHPRIYMFVNVLLNHPLRRCSKPKRILGQLTPDTRAVNLGSGLTNWGPPVVNLEMAEGPFVQVVGDVCRLPYPDNSLDHVFSIVVLEHVPDPDRAVSEMQRVLKPGGRFYALVPFIQGYHEAPFDFRRWTLPGARRLFSGLIVERVEVGDGPTSSLVWILREWFAIALSFNSSFLYSFWFALVTIATFPLKYLDHLLSGYRMAEKIPCNVVVTGRKGGDDGGE